MKVTSCIKKAVHDAISQYQAGDIGIKQVTKVAVKMAMSLLSSKSKEDVVKELVKEEVGEDLWYTHLKKVRPTVEREGL